MLQSIRDRAHSWVAIVIIILFCIPFALYGIGSYFSEGGETYVAKVFDREISDYELRDAIQFKTQTIRSKNPKAKIDDAKVREDSLEEIIRQEVVLHHAITAGYRASESQVIAAIRQIPGLGTEDGGFNDGLYKRFLRGRGMSEGQHFEQMRHYLVAGQYSTAVRESGFLTDWELREYLRLSQQKRDLRYVTVLAKGFLDEVEVTDEAIAAHYQENLDRFTIPEQIQIEYLELKAGLLGQGLEPDEDQIQTDYEARKTTFTKPEQRKVRHILIELSPAADSEETEQALSKAQEIRASLLAGEDFIELAKTLSEDPGSAALGGDLGEAGAKGTRGWDSVFEAAAFALAKEGDISEPVRSEFGFHLIRADEIQAEHTQPLEEVRSQLVADYRQQEGERLFFDHAGEFVNLTFEHPKSLEPAAGALGLEVQRSVWFSREQGGGVAAAEEVRLAAFGEVVYSKSYNSDPIELAPDHTVVVRLVERKAPVAKPLADVREAIVEVLRNEMAKEHARSTGQRLFRLLVEGGDLDKLVEEEGLEAQAETDLNRMQRSVDAAILEQAFRLPKDNDPAFGHAITDDGDFVLMVVSNVRDGSLDDVQENQRDFYKSGLGRLKADVELELTVEELRRQAEVEMVGEES